MTYNDFYNLAVEYINNDVTSDYSGVGLGNIEVVDANYDTVTLTADSEVPASADDVSFLFYSSDHGNAMAGGEKLAQAFGAQLNSLLVESLLSGNHDTLYITAMWGISSLSDHYPAISYLGRKWTIEYIPTSRGFDIWFNSK